MIARADIDSLNPMRPLDWRWRRALHLADSDSRRRCRPWDDELTGLALMYIRRSAQYGAAACRDKLRRQMPAITTAHQLQVAADVMTWMIEARVLAGIEPSEIARQADLSPAVIEAYEGLFFDVRHRLDARCYVQLHALRRPSPDDSRMDLVGWLLRTLAYHGGAVVLELAEAALLDVAPMASHADTVESSEQMNGKLRLLASLVTLPDDVCSRRLLDLLADLAKSTRMGGADFESPFAAACDQLVAQVVVDVPPSQVKDTASEPVKAGITSVASEDQEAA